MTIYSNIPGNLNVNIDDEFEEFYHPFLDSFDPAYFLVRGQVDDTPTIPGSRKLGTMTVGELFTELWSFNISIGRLDAYLVNTNWVPDQIPYVNIGDDEWNPTLIGDVIYMAISEVDFLTAMLQEGTVITTMSARTINAGITASIPNAFGIETGSTQFPALRSNIGYSFNNSQTVQGPATATLTSERVIDLGTEVVTYRDMADDPLPVDNQWVPFLIGAAPNVSYGWGFGNSNLPAFNQGWDGEVNVIGNTALTMIDLIRNE